MSALNCPSNTGESNFGSNQDSVAALSKAIGNIKLQQECLRRFFTRYICMSEAYAIIFSFSSVATEAELRLLGMTRLLVCGIIISVSVYTFCFQLILRLRMLSFPLQMVLRCLSWIVVRSLHPVKDDLFILKFLLDI